MQEEVPSLLIYRHSSLLVGYKERLPHSSRTRRRETERKRV
jgi:hypothetical protein